MRVTAARLGIERLDVATSGGTVTFGETTSVDAAALILAVQRSARTMRFDGPRKLRFSGKFETEDERFTAASRCSRCSRVARPLIPARLRRSAVSRVTRP
jgi:transcription-repair coupling factor (superfamily II helicase)